MRLGVAKTTRESAKPPDEFEAPGVEPVFPQKRQAIDYSGTKRAFGPVIGGESGQSQ
jgi:hypothetical protein